MRVRIILTIALMICPVVSAAAQNWPAFRGPNASGSADGQNPPTKWNVEKNENVVWKTPIPGLAHASPIVWGDKLFVVSAVSSAPPMAPGRVARASLGMAVIARATSIRHRCSDFQSVVYPAAHGSLSWRGGLHR